MMKMIIADDEPFIRLGIRTTIPWEKYGIEIAGEASNGKTALNMAIQLKPDIVLADISMPVMTGLELAAKLNEFLPKTRVIILTAYGTTDNFTSAFQSNVSRFVLKSANSSIILENVLQIKEEIEKELRQNQVYEQLSSIYNENQHLIKSTLFYRFLNNQLAPDIFRKKAEETGIPLYASFYTMILAKCSSRDDWHTITAFQNSFADYQPFAFFVEDTYLLMLLNTNQSGITEAELSAIFPEIKPYILGNQFACMNTIHGLEEFSISFSSLRNRLNDCFWNSDWEYSIISQDYTFLPQTEDKILIFEKDIISSALHQNSLQADLAIDRYYEYCKTHSLSQRDFWDSVKRILLLLTSINSPDTDIELLMSSVYDLETPEEILAVIKSFLNASGSPESQKPHIAAALNYINENYYKNLRLSDVSRQIFLSEGYLSRIFKIETGYSFTEWLHRVRIEKAKELLASSDLKYYEIAEKVGYRDYKYFSAYFNKLCHCSAKEYKNRIHAGHFSAPDHLNPDLPQSG